MNSSIISSTNTLLKLETDRLKLITLTPIHAERVFVYYAHNRHHFKGSMPAYVPGFFSVIYHQALLKQQWQQIQHGDILKLWIFKHTDREQSRIIGDITFSNINEGITMSCVVGYKMDKNHLGKGYMTEALQRAIRYVFGTLKLHRIEANIMPTNIASARLVEKIGFQKEGFSPKYLKINNRWEDHSRYAIINPNEV
mgnify:FL=1